MGSAAKAYAARIDAVEEQRARVSGRPPVADRWGGPMTAIFRADPRRTLDAHTEALASYLQPADVLVDVGGGAGRIGLPLALRCKEVINVEPSPAMGDAFEELARESGIGNARLVRADWLDADPVQGDVALAAHVTYFVRDIVRFIEKMQAAARRRVLLFIASLPPPGRSAALFQRVFGESQVIPPGQQDLLPVLWEMGILPDIHVLPGPMEPPGGIPRTHEDAVQNALRIVALGMAQEKVTQLRATVDAAFEELFEETPNGFRSLFTVDAQLLCVTWET